MQHLLLIISLLAMILLPCYTALDANVEDRDQDLFQAPENPR